MLPFPAGGGLLVPGKAQLSSALPKYRELLRKTRTGAEESSSSTTSSSSSSRLFQQAKERVLLRLRERRGSARVDPRRAFRRLQQRVAAARTSLRDLKNEQKERLRQYYATAVAGGSRAGASGSEAGLVTAEQQSAAAAVAAPASTALDARAAQAALGTDGVLRHLVLAGVGGACKLFLAAGAHTSIRGQEQMAAALARPPGRGLITVSNHVGSIDDPLITSSIVPATKLLEPSAVRWTMCATDRCFKSAALAPFFRAAKVLPVERGAGLDQFGMQLAQSRLAAGEWVHIFPEGTRSRDGRMQPVRKGVGWLVASAAAAGALPPLVLPFVHSGMERILPKGAALPKLGQELRVLVGEPVAVDDLLSQAAQQGWGEERLQVAIADRVGQALYRLKAQLDCLPLDAVAPQPRAAAISISEDTLLPLIEDEMDSLAHRWHDSWQRLSLPSLTQRMRQGAAAARRSELAGGLAGSRASFDDIAAATEEGTGIISAWEHDSAAPAPWALEAAAAADDAAASAAAGGAGVAAAAAAPSPARLLLRQKLRMLRGSVEQAAATLRSSSSIGGGEASSSGGRTSSGLLPDLVSPLDLVARAMGSAGEGASGSGSRLPGLLAAAADYSAARAQHMARLLSAPPSSAGGPSANAAAAAGAHP